MFQKTQESPNKPIEPPVRLMRPIILAVDDAEHWLRSQGCLWPTSSDELCSRDAKRLLFQRHRHMAVYVSRGGRP